MINTITYDTYYDVVTHLRSIDDTNIKNAKNVISFAFTCKLYIGWCIKYFEPRVINDDTLIPGKRLIYSFPCIFIDMTMNRVTKQIRNIGTIITVPNIRKGWITFKRLNSMMFVDKIEWNQFINNLINLMIEYECNIGCGSDYCGKCKHKRQIFNSSLARLKRYRFTV